MPFRVTSAAGALLLLLFVGCTSHPGPSTRMLTMDPLLEGFKKVAAFPSANVQVLTLLAGQFMAAGRDAEGLSYFQALAEGYPNRPEVRALVGLFHARTASEVTILRRVGWVEAGLAELDAAVAENDPFSRFLRGVVCAELPTRFDRATQAIEDLEWVLVRIEDFPDIERSVHVAMARAYQTLGQPEQARLAWRQGGYELPPTDGVPLFNFSSTWTHDLGFFFTSPPALDEVADGIWVASGYDFADIAFVETSEGLVAIDAGTSPETAEAALGAMRTISSAPLTHVFVTHAHRDHIGGMPAYLSTSTHVVANGRFREELETISGGNEVLGQAFWPYTADTEFTINPDVLIGERRSFRVGDREFELIPVDGGETVDALLILDKQTGTLFVGDVFMPYIGGPFIGEGDPEGLLRTIAVIREIAPVRLVHGHAPLTTNFPIEMLQGFEAAMQELHGRVLDELQSGLTVNRVIRQNIVPEVLAEHPEAVVPYMVTRDHFIQRMFHNRNGYWSAHESSWEAFTTDDWAIVLNLVSGNNRRRLEGAASTLLERGDIAMAFQVSRLARTQYQDSERLQAVEDESLVRLRLKYQATDPFRFLLYSYIGNQELQPLPSTNDTDGRPQRP